MEKYQPNKENDKIPDSSDLLSFTIAYTKTTPKYYYTGDHREKIKLYYQELDREDGELDGVEMHEEEETRLNEIMRRILETFLLILITVSSILCICLLCLLKFC